jgi:hypothetical protein
MVWSPALILNTIFGLVSLVCYILVLIKLFQTGQTGLGIICLLLFCCGGIGILVTLIVGWVQSGRLGLSPALLSVYTVAVIISAITGFMAQAQIQAQLQGLGH